MPELGRISGLAVSETSREVAHRIRPRHDARVLPASENVLMLLDQRLFSVEASTFDAFNAALDAPA